MQTIGIHLSETDKNGGRSQSVSEKDKNIVKRQPLRINHFNETLTLSTNPIYDKLKKLFKYDKHQHQIHQDAQDSYRTVKPLQVNGHSKYLLGQNTKNQSFGQNKSLMCKGNKTTVVTQPESLLMENVHVQINNQRLTKEISGQELMKVRPSDLQNLVFRDQKKMLLQNHRIKRVFKPQIKHPRKNNDQIVALKVNQKITPIDENKQNEQPNSKHTNQNENMRNFEFLQQKISFLQEQLSYYHTMEEFYLEELSNYRQNQRHLEWKLQLVTEELLIRAGKSQKNQLTSQIKQGSSNSSTDGKYETKRYDTAQILRISKNQSSERQHETFTLEDVALVESQDQFQPNPQLNKLSASTLSQEPRNLIFF